MGSYILHIETSTRICSVALSNVSDCIALAEDFEGDHTRVLNHLIRTVLAQANLKLNQVDAIAVNEGPGSFTALRIGVVTAKGISFALDKPLIMIPGLKAIASALRNLMPEKDYYLSLIDARRNEVYLAIYNRDLAECFPPQAVILDNELKGTLGISGQLCVIGGDGSAKWNQFIDNWQAELTISRISATHMIPLALDMFRTHAFTETALAKPFYLKLPNITTPKEKLITP